MSAPSSTHPLRIGLTGGIASGKSTVAQLFAALGVPVIDTDAISRDLVMPGTPLLGRLAKRFGTQILSPEGALERRVLRDLVFADPAARADLEELTHPAILEEMNRRSAAAGGPYQILVIPLLVEKNLGHHVDRVLVVDCDEAAQIRRLQARDGATLEQAQAILAAQAPRTARLEAAHDVITNTGGIPELRAQVEALHAKYLRLAAS